MKTLRKLITRDHSLQQLAADGSDMIFVGDYEPLGCCCFVLDLMFATEDDFQLVFPFVGLKQDNLVIKFCFFSETRFIREEKSFQGINLFNFMYLMSLSDCYSVAKLPW
jgi:hypothetical protein